mmetsp:Transcript_19767/g.55863  ORF Transcript_19767/g.55863 Transcript_19767/m.55863 type:complete len:470 (+) Transcript_19767:137-1546(+)
MESIYIEQSLPICCSLAAIGGIFEVGATAVTAVPAVRAKQGVILNGCQQFMALAGNIGLQAVGSLISHLIAPWYGPVSLVVPFFYSATLLSNMVIFGLFLKEDFTKNMRVGTYVIVVAVILLPLVGPDVQENQHVGILMRHWYSIVWFILLIVASFSTGIMLACDVLRDATTKKKFAILLTARASSLSLNLTVSRAFILGPSKPVLILFIIIKILSGAVYTYAIVVQSTTVDQARFVPLNATTIILVNAFTGIIIWEDWRVVSSWYGYMCVFVLLGLGCDLLLSVPLLNADNPEFGRRTAIMIVGQRVQSNRRRRIAQNSNANSSNHNNSKTGGYGSINSGEMDAQHIISDDASFDTNQISLFPNQIDVIGWSESDELEDSRIQPSLLHNNDDFHAVPQHYHHDDNNQQQLSTPKTKGSRKSYYDDTNILLTTPEDSMSLVTEPHMTGIEAWKATISPRKVVRQRSMTG